VLFLFYHFQENVCNLQYICAMIFLVSLDIIISAGNVFIPDLHLTAKFLKFLKQRQIPQHSSKIHNSKCTVVVGNSVIHLKRDQTSHRS
jgi:hypothetical protein